MLKEFYLSGARDYVEYKANLKDYVGLLHHKLENSYKLPLKMMRHYERRMIKTVADRWHEVQQNETV